MRGTTLLGLAGIVLFPLAVPIVFVCSAVAALLAPFALWAAYLMSGTERLPSGSRALVSR